MHRCEHAVMVLALFSATFLSAQGAESWTGFHVGANLGYGFGKSTPKVTLGGAWATESAALQAHMVNGMGQELKPKGALFGLQAGYSYQFQNQLVLGGELGIQGGSVKDSRATGMVPTTPFPSLSYDFRSEAKVKSLLSLQARLGYAIGKQLPYVLLGFASASTEASTSITSNGGYLKAGSASKSVSGLLWGLGYEMKFAQGWSGRVELASASLGELAFTTAYLPGSSFVTPAYTESIKQDFRLTSLSVGVNYRF